MMLLILLAILIGPYLLLTAFNRRLRLRNATRGRVGLTAFFLFTAMGHFALGAAMAEMLPPWVPMRLEIVWVTGALEILGALAVWVPRLERRVGMLLIWMLVGFLPVNLYAAFQGIDFGGHGAGPIYLLMRVPFQFFVIGWVYWVTDPGGVRRQRQEVDNPPEVVS